MLRTVQNCDYRYETDDEVCGVEGATTVEIGWEGDWTAIDLCEEHVKEMGTWWNRLSDLGRQQTRPASRRRTNALLEQAAVSAATIRRWAQERGLEVSHAGRLSGNVISAYMREHGQPHAEAS
jgi:hypothetical protein